MLDEVKEGVDHPTISLEEIVCEIETPQFKNGGTEHTMFKQRGTFYPSTLKFISSGWFSGHDVQFESIESFQKSLVRKL